MCPVGIGATKLIRRLRERTNSISEALFAFTNLIVLFELKLAHFATKHKHITLLA